MVRIVRSDTIAAATHPPALPIANRTLLGCGVLGIAQRDGGVVLASGDEVADDDAVSAVMVSRSTPASSAIPVDGSTGAHSKAIE
jgi:hypothetical protein